MTFRLPYFGNIELDIRKISMQTIYKNETEIDSLYITNREGYRINIVLEIRDWLNRLERYINYLHYDGVCQGRSNAIMSGDVEMDGVYLELWSKASIIGISSKNSRYYRDGGYIVREDKLYVLKGHEEGVYYLNYYCHIAEVDVDNGTHDNIYTLQEVLELDYQELKNKKENIETYLYIKDNIVNEREYKDCVLHAPLDASGALERSYVERSERNTLEGDIQGCRAIDVGSYVKPDFTVYLK